MAEHGARTTLRSDLTAYRAVLRSRVRSQRAYRTSFALDLFGSVLVGLAELAEVWVVFGQVHVLGDLRFGGALLVYGLASIAFALADLVVGHLDTLPAYIRAGTLDAFYLRPLPVLGQLVTSDISLKRLARVGVGAVGLVWGLVLANVAWTPAKLALLTLSLTTSWLVFAGVFTLAAGCQFFLVNGAEMTNAFTYGGSYAAKQPASIFPRGLRLVFGLVLPVSVVGYLPTLVLLDQPGPALLPAWLAWCLPLAAAWTWLLALVMWRTGMRHYQGGGG